MTRLSKFITFMLIMTLLLVTPLQTIDAKKGHDNPKNPNSKQTVQEPIQQPVPQPNPDPIENPSPTPAEPITPTEPIVEPTPEPAKPKKTLLGYYTVYFTGDRGSYNAMNNFQEYVSEVAIVTFKATHSGQLSGTVPTDGITLANSLGIKSHVTVTNEHNGNFDPALAHTILSSASLTKTLIDNIETLIKSHNYSGVNIDFENMYPSDRQNFSLFISELANRLHPNGYEVIVSVSAKNSDSPTVAWIGAFDYAALGQAADKIQIMTYDQHGPWGSAGPVAGYNWMENVIVYAVSQIPSEKILLGLPAYAYDWNLTNNTGNRAIAWRNVPALIASTGATPQWDSASQTPYFRYKSTEGHDRIVWYDNTQSIQLKASLVNKYNLGGVGMWRLGLEDESFWVAVKAGLQ